MSAFRMPRPQMAKGDATILAVPNCIYAADFTLVRTGWLHAVSYWHVRHCHPRTGNDTPLSMAFNTPVAVLTKSASAYSSR
jgi:hypothetical protein